MNTFRHPLLRSMTAIALLGFAPGAFAYLDPSTGSMIISAIVGIFATLTLALKTWWYKIKAFFRGKPAVGDESQNRNPETGDEG